jgi:hypothetical protein
MPMRRKPLKRKTPLKRGGFARKKPTTRKVVKKSKGVKQLKKKAWELLSKTIRLEAREVDGLVTCITCGVRLPWNRGIQAGHFIDGRYNSILFDERGIYPQCMGCNVMLNGRKEEYFIFMEAEQGREVIDALRRQRNENLTFTAEDLTGLIEAYKKRIEVALRRMEP